MITRVLDTLRSQICDRPDDDELRLEFARRVATYDLAQSEFITAQVEAAAYQRNKEHPYHFGLSASRFAPLVERWAEDIVPFIRPAYWRQDPGYSFFRGFVARARLQPETFIARARELFATAPVQHADFCGVSWNHQVPADGFPLDAWLESEGLERLLSIRFEFLLTLDEFIRIVASPRLSGCRWLDIASTGLDDLDETYRILAASPLGKRLRCLNMHAGPLGEFPDVDADRHLTYGPPSALSEELLRDHGDLPWLHADRFIHRFYA